MRIKSQNVHFRILEALNAHEVGIEELRQTVAENEQLEHQERLGEQVQCTEALESPEARANCVVHASTHGGRYEFGECQ